MPSLDYSGSYLFWSQTETVSLKYRNVADVETTISTVTAVRSDVSRTVRDYGNIQILPGACTFKVPVALLGGQIPGQGWKVIDAASKQYTVESVSEERVGASLVSYALTCNLRAA